ncbi:MAG TPA: glycosyltransferase family 4 protein [Myxococcota bacterium]|jgi:colanic acid biosynthesis glycosyl transferase WcaI
MAKRLHVAVVSQFFWPEMGAPAARWHDFGKLLVERGHRVTVLTGLPNSPTGVVPEAYRRRVALREEIDGITVLRGWLYASPRLSAATKSLGFASFALSASAQALLRRLDADVVIATSPPPTVGVPGIVAARRLGVPLVFDVRDLWPEAIASSGRLRSGLLIRTLTALADTIYRQAAAITVVTEGKRERLIEEGVPAEKVVVIPNGVDLGRFLDVPPLEAEELRALGFDPERFLVLYAGIMNPPQGLDVLLDAIQRLAARRPDLATRVQLGLVGGGSERERLEARVRAERLDGLVRFAPVQPRERIPPLLRAAGAITVPLRPRRDTHTVPSKLYEAMASGRPVLVSADGAPNEILREAEAGLATPAADAEALADSIETLLTKPALAQELGANGVRYARRFDRRALVDELERLLLAVTERARR